MTPDARIGRRLSLRDLNIFLVVAEKRSMSRAAEQLAVSQPVVSKAIADMEHVLGVPLLDRAPRGVEPTLYGRALIKRSVAVFDELRLSVTDIESLLDPTTGEVRIGAGQALAVAIVPAVIERLTRQHPRLSFHVVEGGLPVLQRELRDRNIELGIARALTPISDEDMESEVLFADRQVVVAGARSKWARRRKIELSDLYDEPWILAPPGTVPGSDHSEAFRAAGLKLPRAAITTLSLSVNAYLLDTGRFLGLIPESAVHFIGKELPLKVLPIDLPVQPQPVVIVTMKNRTLSSAAKHFIEGARAITRPLASRK